MEETGTPLIRAKLRRPVESNALLARPRLFVRLEQGLTRPLTLVCAGAGYGKTTLVADFLRRRQVRVVWYQVDPNDADASFFLTHFIEGVRQYYSDFGRRTLLRLRASPSPDRESRSLFSLLTTELEEAVRQELVVVLDDFHEVGESEPVVNGLNYLIDYLAPAVRIVILSRTEPRLALRRMQATDQIVRIEEQDLAFNQEEICQLFEDVYRLSVPASFLKDLVEASCGWAIPVVLAAQAWRSQPGAGPGVKSLPKLAVFAYLSEELVATLEVGTQRFLMESALLPWMSTSLVNDYFGTAEAGIRLRDLARKHVFLSIDEDPPIYRYHPLLRDFLLQRLASATTSKDLQRLRHRAALLLEAKGALDDAVDQYVLAGMPSSAARTLQRQALQIAKSGQYHRLSQMISKLPQQLLSRRPLLLVAQGKAEEALGDHRVARRYYLEAGKCALQLHFARAQGEALAALGRLDRLEGNLADAVRLLQDAVRLLRGDRRRMIMGEMAGVYIVTDRFQEAENTCLEFLAASRYARDTQDVGDALHILGLVQFFYAGHPQQGIQTLQTAVRHKHEHGLLASIPFSRAVLALALLLNGESQPAQQEAETAIRTADVFGLAREGALARATLGWALAHQGRAEQGLPALEQAVDLLTQIRDRWFLVVANSGLCLLYEQLGDHSGVRHALVKLNECATALGSDFHRAWALAIEAAYWRRRGESTRSLKNLEQALGLAERSKGPFVLIPIHIQMAALNHAAGRFTEAANSLNRAVELFASHRYQGFLGMTSAEAAQIITALIRDSRDRHEAAQEMLRALTPDEPLAFSVLGTFRVLRGNKPIADVQWQRPRVETLCKFLLVNHHRILSREQVCEALWLDLAPEAARNNLRWALSVLRRVLGDRLVVGGDPSHLTGARSSLCIKLRPTDTVDVDEFSNLLRRAQAATRPGEKALALQEAVGLYRGELLAENQYDDWPVTLREQLKNQYLDAVQELAAYYEADGNAPKALTLWQRILADEPDNEAAHRGAIRCYAGLGRVDAVHRQYRECVDSLRRELGVEPSAETTTLFSSLTGE